MADVVFNTMGTTVSLHSLTELAEPDVLAVREAFARLDRQFSLYRADSEASRIARGERRLTASTSEFREAYARAIEWRELTMGAFTPHRPDGVIDLSGIVKAMAITAAGDELRGRGYDDWILNAGGDILVAGNAADSLWLAGIVDPADRAALLCSVPLIAPWQALATSGTAERGEHVWRTSTAAEFVQVTVLAATIEEADVLATAILSAGCTLRDDVLDCRDVDVITVDREGQITASQRVSRHSTLVSA
ncbi:FAD:protein FMN transferase [Klugiella xanthotipulae]|uniref:FAD:protein FMN transferase n=1 Tax=Klugiella xanthotipulae TaxID=244735 RepID=A0A543I479_9MICO|nr:FAD:protein FMN transferase [Klugiella xanthotipulae]TQM65367.1 thiamine biosynthesis lipoprotein [Klugiella xanthotipulae]